VIKQKKRKENRKGKEKREGVFGKEGRRRVATDEKEEFNTSKEIDLVGRV